MAEIKEKYLYCLIKEVRLKKFDILGIAKKEIYTINQGGFAAVVSDALTKGYSISRENTLTHQKVIEEIMKVYDVLPFGFGIVAPNVQDVKKSLCSKPEELKKEFAKIKGKVELNLKALWLDMPNIFQEIAQSSPEIQKAKSQKTTRNDLIKIGELVSQLLQERRGKEVQTILKPLKEIAVDFKQNELFGDDMILNAAFLVERDKEKEFDKKVGDLRKKHDKRIKSIYIGPLPPFNFVKLHL